MALACPGFLNSKALHKTLTQVVTSTPCFQRLLTKLSIRPRAYRNQRLSGLLFYSIIYQLVSVQYCSLLALIVKGEKQKCRFEMQKLKMETKESHSDSDHHLFPDFRCCPLFHSRNTATKQKSICLIPYLLALYLAFRLINNQNGESHGSIDCPSFGE